MGNMAKKPPREPIRLMRSFGLILGLAVALAVLAPRTAYACLTCGNHGDTLATLYVFGTFMTVPWMLAAGVAVVIRKQMRALEDDSVAHPGS